ncbi:MAG: low specificity L-threonine aldolase [Planctomycetota bacterium]|nr:MAG: low specificity L-threonine aldolase [Planctomycetota bacterium]
MRGERVADFRSDTVTRPTPRMLEALLHAKVGDDVLGDDPTVQALERRVAEMLGQEAALFMPSGTMSNQCAVAAHIEPGEEVIVGTHNHVFQYEGGGLARIAGAHVRTIDGEGGMMPLERLSRAVRMPSVHMPRTALICLEQTHLVSGGTIVPLRYLQEVRALSRDHGLPVHLDGARLWNAHVETGVPLREYGACADSISVSLNKGLCCPLGSLLAGSGAFVERAKRVRKWMGGGLRQSGYVAAMALTALDEVLPLLADDNARCRRLGGIILGLPGLSIAQPTIDTNILFVEVTDSNLDAPAVETALADHGVLALALGERLLRFVTHRDVSDADVERAAMALQQVVAHP